MNLRFEQLKNILFHRIQSIFKTDNSYSALKTKNLKILSLIFFFLIISINHTSGQMEMTAEGNYRIPDSIKIVSEGSVSEVSSEKNDTGNSDVSSGQHPFGDGTIWREQSDLKTGRFLSLMGAIAAIDLAGYIKLQDIWYNQRRSYFHTLDFAEDFRKYRWMDKMGHAMDAYFSGDLAAKGFRWAGMSGDESVLYGALTGWLWMLQIELSDAFFLEWGFSWGDLLANSIGSGFLILQQFNKDIFGGIQPKISYHVSQAWREKNYIKLPQALIDDYEGMTFWLSFNIYHYMPESVQKNYPDWLKPINIAVGYSAKGIGINPQGGQREFLIGLDLDIRKIPFFENSALAGFIKSELNFLKVPMPAFRITPHGVWYGFYF